MIATVPVKSELLAVRATPARKALYVERAAREGVRVSEWLRMQADRRVRELADAARSAGREE